MSTIGRLRGASATPTPAIMKLLFFVWKSGTRSQPQQTIGGVECKVENEIKHDVISSFPTRSRLYSHPHFANASNRLHSVRSNTRQRETLFRSIMEEALELHVISKFRMQRKSRNFYFSWFDSVSASVQSHFGGWLVVWRLHVSVVRCISKTICFQCHPLTVNKFYFLSVCPLTV